MNMNLVNTATNLQNNQNTISEKVDKLISDLSSKLNSGVSDTLSLNDLIINNIIKFVWVII